jgi:hypothetical protein
MRSIKKLYPESSQPFYLSVASVWQGTRKVVCALEQKQSPKPFCVSKTTSDRRKIDMKSLLAGSMSGLSVSHRAGYHLPFCHVLDRTESPRAVLSLQRRPSKNGAYVPSEGNLCKSL